MNRFILWKNWVANVLTKLFLDGIYNYDRNKERNIQTNSLNPWMQRIIPLVSIDGFNQFPVNFNKLREAEEEI